MWRISSLFSDGTIDGTGSMLLVKIDQSSTSSMSSTFEALQKALEKSGSVSLTGPIADALVIGLPTVKTHVAHILAKIHARDRVQAVVFAYDNALVRPGEPTED